jgi:hypothetical protein
MKEPYIGMPIYIGSNSGYRPGNGTNSGNSMGVTGSGSGGMITGSGSGMSTGSSGSGNFGGGMNTGSGGTSISGGSANFDNRLLGSLPIAMAYTPMQQWGDTYSKEEALEIGTVFPELNLPFEGAMGKGGVHR